jgi:hypothetical protein
MNNFDAMNGAPVQVQNDPQLRRMLEKELRRRIKYSTIRIQ